jgi:hypothetical protein
MPTAVDVMDKIKQERQVKFAQETKPMQDYIGQMIAVKQNEENIKNERDMINFKLKAGTDAQETVSEKRAEDIATTYKAVEGGEIDLIDAMADGKVSMEVYEGVKGLQSRIDWTKIDKATEGMDSSDPSLYFETLSIANEDWNLSDVKIASDLIAGRNLNKVYSDVIKSADSKATLKEALDSDRIDGYQYKSMLKSIGSGDFAKMFEMGNQLLQNGAGNAEIIATLKKAFPDVDDAELKLLTGAFSTDIKARDKALASGNVSFQDVFNNKDIVNIIKNGSPELVKELGMNEETAVGLGYNAKIARAKKILNANGVKYTSNDDNNIATLLDINIPTDGEIKWTQHRVDYLDKNIFDNDPTTNTSKKGGILNRQDYLRNLQTADLNVNGASPINSLGQFLNETAIERIEKRGNRDKEVWNTYAIDPSIPISSQLIDNIYLKVLIDKKVITREDILYRKED